MDAHSEHESFTSSAVHIVEPSTARLPLRSPPRRALLDAARSTPAPAACRSHACAHGQRAPNSPPLIVRKHNAPHPHEPSRSPADPPAVEAMLTAFGNDWKPLPETVRVLDEIVTECVPLPLSFPQNQTDAPPSFIIESAHLAATAPLVAQRSKIKVDDFRFALRRDPRKLGRVTELLSLEKDMKRDRRAFEVDEGLAPGQAPGPGRGRGKRKAAAAASAAVGEGVEGSEAPAKGGRRKKAKTEEPGSSGAE